MKHYLLGLWMIPFVTALQSQVHFTDASHLLHHQNITSGVAMGVADMNGDSLDDIIRLDDTRRLRIDYQQADSLHFTGKSLNTLFGHQWSMCIGDVNNDGYNDIFTGGLYNGLKVLLATDTGTAYLSQVYTSPSIFLQSSNFVDINGDGAIDIFACHDEGLSVILRNLGDGQFVPDTNLIKPTSTVPSDNSGNYASIWTDFDNDQDVDLYISKCREGVQDPGDGRRLNLLFQNEGNGIWSEVADSLGLQPRAQSWATDFADIDNDGDLDCFIINHDIPSQLLLNNGNHEYIDISDSINLPDKLTGSVPAIQGKFADFDNNGFQDLLVTSTGDQHILLLNEGDLVFTHVSDSLVASKRIQSASIGDLNNDGFLDIIAGFANSYNQPSSQPDKLFLNDGNDHHYLKVLLQGSQSNYNGIGARINCYGPWGVQIREVRSGEGYGVMHSFTQHFGLAQHQQIDSVTIYWPSGVIDKIENPPANQLLVVEEGQSCVVGLSFTWEADEFEHQFQSSTAGSQLLQWSFGDGNDTLAMAPMHVFDSVGTYEVCASLDLSCGLRETSCQMVEVICAPPTGDFKTEADELNLTFIPVDTDGLLFHWTFGDGSDSSHLAQPSHLYTAPGDYEVCLTITDNCQTTTRCQTVEVRCGAPTPSFAWVANELAVTFSDHSTGEPSQWAWSLGDGNTSDSSQFTHHYALPGTYEICLRVSNICGGEDQMTCQDITLTCTAPVAAFDYGKENLSLTFIDGSSASPSSWLWTFGDGDTATVANPSHTYSTAGQYEVCLTSSSICGSDQRCRLINVGCEVPIAQFSVQGEGLWQSFQDSSLASPTAWLWSFGDGHSSALQHPEYVYAEAGTFSVCLTVTNACGSDQHCQELRIINTSTANPSKAQPYRLFPNPTKDWLYLHASAQPLTPELLSIYNLQGQLIQRTRPTRQGNVALDLRLLVTGVYFLRIEAQGQGYWLRFVKR